MKSLTSIAILMLVSLASAKDAKVYNQTAHVIGARPGTVPQVRGLARMSFASTT
jgi:hypothetical protein